MEEKLPPVPPKKIQSIPKFVPTASNSKPVPSREAAVVVEEMVAGRTRSTTGGKENKGFGKMISFPWGGSKNDKKLSTLPASNSVSTPALVRTTGPVTSSSLPLGFPSPPIPARQHSSTIVPHLTPLSKQKAVKSSESNNTMSTMASSFSLASTNLFTDEWESSNSIPSSPDYSPNRPRNDGENVMWVVKGLSDSKIDEGYDGIEEDRSVTPIPKKRSPQDPTTPPSKRNSISTSTPESKNTYNQAAKMIRAVSETLETLPFDTEPDSPGDADDEISPPRNRKRYSNKVSLPRSESLEKPFNTKIRIPSIRFEGISMEGVFAEVEKKMAAEAEVELARGGSESGVVGNGREEKKARRRTKVFSIYRSMEKSINDSELVEKVAETVAPAQAFRRPARSSSRPSPLNIAAANSTRIRSITSPTSPTSYASPPLAGAFTLQSNRDSNGIFSPLEQSFNSPLGTAFNSALPSPALSTSSTVKMGIELPEVNVVPPTPTLEEIEEWNSMNHDAGKVVTKVVLLEERRTVRISTRANPTMRRNLEKKTIVPEPEPIVPLSPALSINSINSVNSNETIETSARYKTNFIIPSISSLNLSEGEITEEESFSTLLRKLNRPFTPPPTEAIIPSLPFPTILITTNSPTKGSESDDSMTRFGDAPISLSTKTTTSRMISFSENLSSSSSSEETEELTESEGYDSIGEDLVEIRFGERVEINGYEMGMAM